jgi:hypothetical protein
MEKQAEIEAQYQAQADSSQVQQMQAQLDAMQAQQARRRSRRRRPRPPPRPAGPILLAQLTQLQGLKDAGVLNDAEFAAAKAKLLGTDLAPLSRAQRAVARPERRRLPFRWACGRVEPTTVTRRGDPRGISGRAGPAQEARSCSSTAPTPRIRPLGR